MTTREEAKARNTPEPRTHQINLRLSRAEYARLTKSAALSGLGRAAYLRMVVTVKPTADKNLHLGECAEVEINHF